MDLNKIYNIDCIEGLRQLPDESVHCCVTSPPYWGLRDYGVAGQYGLEETPEAFVSRQVDVFQEVRRVLRKGGTCWVNIGDSYAASAANRPAKHTGDGLGSIEHRKAGSVQLRKDVSGLKRKDLVGIPWMLAFALRQDGWYLRQDIIWSKPNPMPESVTDRCTKSHEYIFLLTKSDKYYFNQETIKEPASANTHARRSIKTPASWDTGQGSHNRKSGRYSNTGVGWGSASNNDPTDNRKRPSRVKNNSSFDTAMHTMPEKRNKRSVWAITPQAYKGAHFATFPEELPHTCILAGCPPDGVVLDPYMGVGTTALVARKLQRNFIGFELNPRYHKEAETRLIFELGMFI